MGPNRPDASRRSTSGHCLASRSTAAVNSSIVGFSRSSSSSRSCRRRLAQKANGSFSNSALPPFAPRLFLPPLAFVRCWQNWASRYGLAMRRRSRGNESASRRPTATMLDARLISSNGSKYPRRSKGMTSISLRSCRKCLPPLARKFVTAEGMDGTCSHHIHANEHVGQLIGSTCGWSWRLRTSGRLCVGSRQSNRARAERCNRTRGVPYRIRKVGRN
jgi:hypothetical protein